MIANAQWVTLAVFGLVCLGLIVLTAGAWMGKRFSNPRYAFLAAGYLSLLFVAGVGMLLTDGWYGNGRILLVILPLLAAFLFGSGSLASFIRLTALVCSIAVVAIIGLFVGYGQDPVIKPLPDTSSLLNWAMMVGGFSLVGLVCALALNGYLRVLEKSLNNSEQRRPGFRTGTPAPGKPDPTTHQRSGTAPGSNPQRGRDYQIHQRSGRARRAR